MWGILLTRYFSQLLGSNNDNLEWGQLHLHERRGEDLESRQYKEERVTEGRQVIINVCAQYCTYHVKIQRNSLGIGITCQTMS